LQAGHGAFFLCCLSEHINQIERERLLFYFALVEQDGQVDVVMAMGEDTSGKFSYLNLSIALAGSTMSVSL
jgi:hypothetical protein